MSCISQKCIFRFNTGEPDIEIEVTVIPVIGDVVEIETGTSSNMQVNGKKVKVKHVKWLKIENKLIRHIESLADCRILFLVSETTTF